MDRPRPWLRYVNADDLDDTSVKFAGMTVENAQGEKLGTVSDRYQYDRVKDRDAAEPARPKRPWERAKTSAKKPA